ncbi:MAG: S1 RNA-binding domain-containing protein [Anaerolineae bacterium]|nr:S1 RNA-binding domain-containing protein [Anaerolineae bacterium]
MGWDETARWSEENDEAYWQALLREVDAMFPPVAPAAGGRIGGEGGGNGVSEGGSEPLAAEDEARGLAISLERAWQLAEEALETGEVLELLADGFNRGGLLVSWGQLRGFVPYSQLSGMPHFADSDGRMQALESRVGQTLRLRVIEVDRDLRRLILSERAACGEARAGDLLARLCPGDICTGRVTRVHPFGIFVDLGGVEGLIHISELSWGWVAHPSEVLRQGDELKVYVIGVNQAERKVALSLKRLTPDPWSLVDERYKVGQLVRGVITNVVSFGAFVQLEEGVEGLIHVSELANGDFMHPRMVVQEGREVTARILEIDSANRRLALSLRQAYSRAEPGTGD